MASWTSNVGGRIAAHMNRTPRPGQVRGQVTVRLSVTVAANGAASARLANSTGHAGWDTALARQAARMPQMPAPPNGQGQSFILPITVRPR
ncbi:MAG: energy transducer TonB [Paracoccus sp. (in: a-proteobacteria)]|nr:energy transducer TonB [Paracoccus sp. (in: a-proteobacteria)]